MSSGPTMDGNGMRTVQIWLVSTTSDVRPIPFSLCCGTLSSGDVVFYSRSLQSQACTYRWLKEMGKTFSAIDELHD